MKRIVGLLMLIIFVLSITACSSVENEIESDSILILDKSYVMPIKVSELIDDGWEVQSDFSPSNRFEANTVSIPIGGVTLINDGNEILLTTLCNDEDEEVKLEDCTIHAMVFNLENITNDEMLKLPGNVTMNSTFEDIKAAYEAIADKGFELDTTTVDMGRGFSCYNKNTRISYSFDLDDSLSNITSISIDYHR